MFKYNHNELLGEVHVRTRFVLRVDSFRELGKCIWVLFVLLQVAGYCKMHGVTPLNVRKDCKDMLSAF